MEDRSPHGGRVHSQGTVSQNNRLTDPLLASERALLGALLLDVQTIETIGELTPIDFLGPKHQDIYVGIMATHADVGPMGGLPTP